VTTVADPLPQALVLTAIVISMAVTLYLIAVMGVTAKREGVVDVQAAPEADDADVGKECRQLPAKEGHG